MTLVARTIIPQLSIWLNKLFLAKSKFKEIIHIGLNKHQRRNTMSNTLMVLSFSILFFAGSMVNVLGTESILQKELNNGVDLEIQENFPQEFSLSFQQSKDLEQIPGVASVSAEIHELSSISQAYLQMNLQILQFFRFKFPI